MYAVCRARSIQVLQFLDILSVTVILVMLYRCHAKLLSGWLKPRVAQTRVDSCDADQMLTQLTVAPAKLSMYCPLAQSWQCPASSQSVTRGSSKSPVHGV